MMKKIIMLNVILAIIFLLAAGCSTVENNDLSAGWGDPSAYNPIDNSSLEFTDTSDPDMPEHWSHDCWGNSTAAFFYLDKGYSGYRSVKTEVTDYNDGDAKWFFNPVQLAAGDYIFSDYYRSDVDTRVVAAVTDYLGNTEYSELPKAPASKNWMEYKAYFAMPKHGETMTVYHLLSQNGRLVTDEYSVRPYRFEGFNRGLVTITFDNGYEENTETALPIMRQFGFKSNQFYSTADIQNPWVPNPKELIQKFIDAGHEIGSHSVTHPDLTTLSERQLTAELEESKSFLENYLGINIKYFASPYGSYNTFVNETIMKYYDAHRSVDAGYNSKDNFDLSRLKVQNILSTTTSADVAEWAHKAKKEKLWLILLYHRVANDPKLYDTTPAMFFEHIRAIKDAGIPVVTFSGALAELESQLNN